MDFLNKLWGGVKSAGSGLLGLFGGGSGGATAGIAPGQTGYGQLTPQQLMQQNGLKDIGIGGEGGGGFLQSLFNPQTILGSVLTGVGLLKKPPKVPQSQAFNQYQSQVKSGGTPLGQLGQSKLTEQLNQNYEPLAQPEIDAALRELERNQVIEEDKVRDLYRNLRPGTDPSTDSSFQRDLSTVSDQFSRAKADTLATRTRDTQAIFNQQRVQQIQTALGANEQQMNQLAQIAQLDILQIMTQLNLDYAQAQAFKETFLGLGGDLLRSGLNTQPDILSLFGGQ